MKRQRTKLFIFCTNYDPGLTLTYHMAGKILQNNYMEGFYMRKCDNDGFFGLIASCDLELD